MAGVTDRAIIRLIVYDNGENQSKAAENAKRRAAQASGETGDAASNSAGGSEIALSA
jgi:hypothetical protein